MSTNQLKRQPTAVANSNTMLLHVNLPKELVTAVRSLAFDQRRTITSQVALLLEQAPELEGYMTNTSES